MVPATVRDDQKNHGPSDGPKMTHFVVHIPGAHHSPYVRAGDPTATRDGGRRKAGSPRAYVLTWPLTIAVMGGARVQSLTPTPLTHFGPLKGGGGGLAVTGGEGGVLGTGPALGHPP